MGYLTVWIGAVTWSLAVLAVVGIIGRIVERAIRRLEDPIPKVL